MTDPVTGTALISTHELVHEFRTRRSSHTALDHVSVSVNRGTSLGVVGESGSGKTTLVRCMLGLLRPTSGTVTFDDTELGTMNGRERRRMRSRIGMVFQTPVQALNPRMTVADSVSEPLQLHGRMRAPDRQRRVEELLEQVGLAASHRDRLPHQLSGGQCQRVGIARALATSPELLILDEPTSALDVSVQAQILNLLRDLRAEHGLTFIMISHDLDVVRYLAESVVVMLRGRVVERGLAEQVLTDPRHDYTRELVAASPSVDSENLRSLLPSREDSLT
ncbi:ABC transporter ATP-binding protein [Nocardioides sp. GCM10027113]|uniref:ABC transporter ATP-binding protein n=1 Tax=unclassified Nocardioides TaxID=2615069 RepID=UPI00362235A9